ncbi:MAG: N-6 DNA methylase, partial [Bacteroidetes bacterium]|nr:N-6 DNA methylase [Bacteroidota bacterium]
MRPSIASRRKIKIFVPELFPVANDFSSPILDDDPIKALQIGKLLAKAWSQSIAKFDGNLAQAHTFFFKVIDSYWYNLEDAAQTDKLRELPCEVKLTTIDSTVISLAQAIGKAASKLDLTEASYLLGNIYTSVLPEDLRSRHGIFYTPPSLTARLLNLIEEAGVDWSRARVLDPACGGGAFLAPVAIRQIKSLKGNDAEYVLNHIETHLTGFDIDPFGAWFSQVFLDVALKDITRKAGRKMALLTFVCDSLEKDITREDKYDVVIGNPPYGKVKLTPELRKKYKRGLYGHANLYGLFTDLALRLVKKDGIIGYLTPTSFLSGEYFKNLRALIRKQCTPYEMDFVAFRKGVF